MIETIRKQLMALPERSSEEEVLARIEAAVLDSEEELPLSAYRELIRRIYVKLRSKLGILELFLDDETVHEIMINGPEHIFLETKTGMMSVEDRFDSVEELEEIMRNIAASVHREINELNPILDARLPDGSRVNAIYKNIVADGPVLTIRKFAKERIRMTDLLDYGSLTRECAEDLSRYVACGYNIFVSGGTSSGKTTFLNALSEYVPNSERVIVIEDSRELQLSHIENLVQLECHQANSLGKGEVTMDMLIRASLRMRPDRIIVGEVRGKEVADMLQAMNTGHYGMSTGHGNSAEGMLRRLEAMYLMGVQIPMDAIRAQIVEGIDLMVHLRRMDDGRRRVVEVQELLDYRDQQYQLNPLYVLDEQQKLVSTGNTLKNTWKLQWKGAKEDD